MRLLFLLLLLSTAAFAGCRDGDPFDTQQLDLREFERFQIDQTAWLSPYGCPDLGLVDHAVITRTGDSEYELTFSTPYVEGAYWKCREEAADPAECDKGVLGVPRRLDASDLEELFALFSSVSVSFAPDPCVGVGSDPCRVTELTWDELVTYDLECTQTRPWLDVRFANDVLRAMTALTER